MLMLILSLVTMVDMDMEDSDILATIGAMEDTGESMVAMEDMDIKRAVLMPMFRLSLVTMVEMDMEVIDILVTIADIMDMVDTGEAMEDMDMEIAVLKLML